MGKNLIHETAIISDSAKIGENVKIGAFAIIESDVVIGDNTEIRSHSIISNGSRIGKDCLICSGAIIATEPQDLKFEGESSLVIIGDRTKIREYCTVNRGTKATGKTLIGDDCLIMAYSHVAHDCVIGNRVVIANTTQLAGHVRIYDWAVIGGVVKIHQFCKIGTHCMISADSYITKDVPHYTLVGSVPPKIFGINKTGLRRRGFSKELIKEIDDFYKTILFSEFNVSEGIKEFSKQFSVSSEVKNCIDFIKNSTRGIYTSK